jgi:hypothetical protein
MVFISDQISILQNRILNSENPEMAFGMLIFYNRLFLKRLFSLIDSLYKKD